MPTIDRIDKSGKDDRPDRVSRVFDVLELLASHSPGMTLTEVSRRLELPPSSTHNLLQRMVATDVVAVDDNLRYSVGPRAVRLGFRIVDGLDLRAIARRHLQELARRTGDDVYLGVRLGRRVVYVERIAGSRAVSIDIRLGLPLLLHATAVGKLFAAYLPQLERRLLSEDRPRLTEHTLVERTVLEQELERIRADGHALSREEAIIGVVGLAVPVFDAAGKLVAGVHVSAWETQFADARVEQMLAAAREAAASIEGDLGREQPVVDDPVS